MAALSLLFFAITGATFTSLGVVLPAMIAELHWSWGAAGLGFTILAVSCGLASLAPTVVVRTLGVRPTLGAGGVVLGAGLLLFARAEGVGGYFAGAALAGLGFALTAIIPGAYVLARSFARPAFPIGLYFTAGGLGGAAGPLLSRLGLEHGWRGYWATLAAVVVALAALAALAVDPRWERLGGDAHPAEADEGWSVRDALRTPQFWIVTAAYTAYLLCGVTVNSVSVQHLGERGLGAAMAAGFLAADNLLNALSRLAGGALVQRVGPRPLTAIALACLVAGMAALALAHGPAMAGLYVLGVGVGYGLSYLATAVLLLAYFGRRRNLELFSLMCLVSTLAAVGPWLAGVSHDRTGSFTPALWAFAAVGICALAAVLAMRPPRRTGAALQVEELGVLVKDVG
ncbi:MAG: MFS transporter [Caulobacteraceae bacterium]|nr:MFS transporter [Caulobacter sp.]